jgi:hypothetical protein
MQGAISSKYRGRLLYLPSKIRQPDIFYMSLFFVSQYFYNPNIILPLQITNILLDGINHDGSD